MEPSLSQLPTSAQAGITQASAVQTRNQGRGRGRGRGRGKGRGRGRGIRGAAPGGEGDGGAGNPGLVAGHNWTPDCGRGSKSNLSASNAVEPHISDVDVEIDIDQELAEVDAEQSRPDHERQPLSLATMHLLSCMVAACQSILSESGDSHFFCICIRYPCYSTVRKPLGRFTFISRQYG